MIAHGLQQIGEVGYMIYAGVGSRSTPKEILREMVVLGRTFAAAGWILRSGRAQGADQAFEHGCDMLSGSKEIYLPWPGFPGEGRYDYPDTKFSESGLIAYKPTASAVELASRELGAGHWSRLSSGGRALHSRNMHQILGLNLNQSVHVLVCWAPPIGDQVTGGTNTAWKLARQCGAMCYNLYNVADCKAVIRRIS